MSEYLLTDLLLYGLSAVIAIACIVDYRRHRRIRDREKGGLCLQCGYSLAGNVSGVCPECGMRAGKVG